MKNYELNIKSAQLMGYEVDKRDVACMEACKGDTLLSEDNLEVGDIKFSQLVLERNPNIWVRKDGVLESWNPTVRLEDALTLAEKLNLTINFKYQTIESLTLDYDKDFELHTFDGLDDLPRQLTICAIDTLQDLNQ